MSCSLRDGRGMLLPFAARIGVGCSFLARAIISRPPDHSGSSDFSDGLTGALLIRVARKRKIEYMYTFSLFVDCISSPDPATKPFFLFFLISIMCTSRSLYPSFTSANQPVCDAGFFYQSNVFVHAFSQIRKKKGKKRTEKSNY